VRYEAVNAMLLNEPFTGSGNVSDVGLESARGKKHA
jgi:hypothetical protein